MVKNRRNTNKLFVATILVLVCIAYVCGIIAHKNRELYGPLSYVRLFIYTVVFISWAFSVYRRVIHHKVRKYMFIIAVLMELFVVVCTVATNIGGRGIHSHWLGYLSYVSLTAIPMYALFVSYSVFRNEEFRLPTKVRILYIPLCIMILLVLTNDLHHIVFTVSDGSDGRTAGRLLYAAGSQIIGLWIAACLVVSLYLVFGKNRTTNKSLKIKMPSAILVGMGAYSLLYTLYVPFIRTWLPDMPVMFCLFLMAYFESLFQLNFIQTNSRYLEIFGNIGIDVAILDKEGREIAASDDYSQLPADAVKASAEAPVILENSRRLSSAPISSGRVIWTEDVSELFRLTDELESTREELTVAREKAEKEYETGRRKQQIIEKKYLYDEVMHHTEGEICHYINLVDSLRNETDPEKIRDTVFRITVVCAYIKRKISMVFQAQENGMISGDQFDLCIRKDSLPCICQFGASGNSVLDFYGEMPVLTAIAYYDTFYAAVSNSLDSLKSVEVRLFKKGGEPVLELTVETGADLSLLKSDFVKVERDGAYWIITADKREENIE